MMPDQDGYLTITELGAFQDIPVKGQPAGNPGIVWLHCPRCHGHGLHNLRLNVYRHPHPHFQQMCGQCWGWGWVQQGSPDETCLHEYAEQTIATCEHRLTCQKCGQTFTVDSSG